MRSNKNILLILLLIKANISNAFLDSFHAIDIFTLSVGPGWLSRTNHQNIFLEPDLEYGFNGEQNNHTLVNSEIFLGTSHKIPFFQKGEFGLAFFMSNNAQLSGDIWVDNNSNYNDFNYQYSIEHYHLALKEKVFISQFNLQNLTPYIDASLGIGFNHSHAYNISSKIFEQIPPGLFSPHTTTSLSYTLGIGLEKSLSSHMNIGIAYEWINWG